MVSIETDKKKAHTTAKKTHRVLWNSPLTYDDIKRLYPELIDETEVGTFSGEPYHIHTDQTVQQKHTSTKTSNTTPADAFV